MSIIKEIMLVYVSVSGNGKSGNNGNNNKFYKMVLEDNGNLTKTYGRIGTKGITLNSNGGEKEFLKIKKQKEKKGYKELKVENNSIESNNKANLEQIVLSQIDYKDNESKQLLKYLVNQNIHNVISNTNIKFDIKTGLFSTPLGVIKEELVKEAKEYLKDILKYFNNYNANYLTKTTLTNVELKNFILLNENYFSIIPTKIADLRNFDNLLTTKEKINYQNDICDSLLTSINIIDSEKKQKISDNNIKEKFFNTKISLVKNKKEFNEINKYFKESKNSKHGNYINSAKIKNIYKIVIDKEEKEFNKKINNVMKLWHGTKVCNLLSILKSSLLMPKESPGQTTGYMFGQGLYFSNQSTKSLNYCDGMYWNNSKKTKNIYMFLCSVAMGKYQIPDGYNNKKLKKGYDSFWAKPGKSGIKNDEMIVFKNNQIRIDYLLEIEK